MTNTHEHSVSVEPVVADGGAYTALRDSLKE
jgi:hypothetical protein